MGRGMSMGMGMSSNPTNTTGTGKNTSTTDSGDLNFHPDLFDSFEEFRGVGRSDMGSGSGSGLGGSGVLDGEVDVLSRIRGVSGSFVYN